MPINGARHEVLQERDVYRQAALAAFHAFIPGADAEVSEELRRASHPNAMRPRSGRSLASRAQYRMARPEPDHIFETKM